MMCNSLYDLLWWNISDWLQGSKKRLKNWCLVTVENSSACHTSPWRAAETETFQAPSDCRISKNPLPDCFVGLYLLKKTKQNRKSYISGLCFPGWSKVLKPEGYIEPAHYESLKSPAGAECLGSCLAQEPWTLARWRLSDMRPECQERQKQHRLPCKLILCDQRTLVMEYFPLRALDSFL